MRCQSDDVNTIASQKLTGVDVSGDSDNGQNLRLIPAWTPGIDQTSEAKYGDHGKEELHIYENECRCLMSFGDGVGQMKGRGL